MGALKLNPEALGARATAAFLILAAERGLVITDCGYTGIELDFLPLMTVEVPEEVD